MSKTATNTAPASKLITCPKCKAFNVKAEPVCGCSKPKLVQVAGLELVEVWF